MNMRIAQGLALENKPKFPFSSIRPIATTLFFDEETYIETNVPGRGWRIGRRTGLGEIFEG